MTEVEAGLKRLIAAQSSLPAGLRGPLADGGANLHEAIGKLAGLVQGYNQAQAFLPELLGVNGERRYLILPQNDTELFPSGGLISSYGIATFDDGRLTNMDLEYFGTLFDRWQRESNDEYVEPPAPLKRYLLRDYSWALGEAGWYPDFPTTARLARGFVAKGGAPDTDGTIAIDLQFLAGLLDVLGDVTIPEYGVTVTPQNVDELTLEMTRDDDYARGKQHEAFLSHFAGALLDRLNTAPKDRWIDLLAFLDRMGEERHLQLQFTDPRMQELSELYKFDGRLVPNDGGDYLLIADASVNSTKLNLILETRLRLDLTLRPGGQARSLLTYEVANPFPEWQRGRDPRLVRALMLDGVYGSYLRIYTPKDARLLDLRLAGKSVGAEQSEMEMGHQMFGRFFPVLPGATTNAQFLYETPAVVQRLGDGRYHYSLYLQKEAGIAAPPLQINLGLPENGTIEQVMLDGKLAVPEAQVETDLRTDRHLDVIFRMN